MARTVTRTEESLALQVMKGRRTVAEMAHDRGYPVTDFYTATLDPGNFYLTQVLQPRNLDIVYFSSSDPSS